MLELNKISYSSMLSRKISNLILLFYFAFVMLVLLSHVIRACSVR